MTIHVVAAGQTLFSIANTYGIDIGLLAGWNGLRPPYALAVGQSLLILEPTETYTVQPGDTLSRIARQTGQTVLQLLRGNPALGGVDRIYPGQVLAIAYREALQGAIAVNGYAYPFVRPEILRGIMPYTSYLTPFTYGITAEGGLVELSDSALLAIAAQYGVSPLMHLSTLTENDTFSTQRAELVLSDPEKQARLIADTVQNVTEKGYRGLDLDFEFLGRDNAAPYAAFAGRMRQAMNALGYPLITALAPKTSDNQPGLLYEGHDYAALADASDAVLLMTYEWGYTYGPPMAVAPIDAVRRVVEYALSRIPPEKILLGFPNYGYDWTLPYEAGTTKARSISNEEAVTLAVQNGAEIRFDERAQTSWFSYQRGGQLHEVWFEDARSTLAKYNLILEFALRGVGFWNYMRPFAVGFSLLNSMFQILPGV